MIGKLQFQTLSESQPNFHRQIPRYPSQFFSISATQPIISGKYTLTQSGFLSCVADSTSIRLFAKTTKHQTAMVSSSSSLDGQSSLVADEFKPFELYDVPDFHRIASPEGFISICGFGSLLSERSARSTFPNLNNFRVGKLKGFRRVFAHVAPIFFERGIAKPETKEISSLSVEPCEGEELVVTVFEIQEVEVPSFIERELEFRFLAVLPETLEGKPFTNPAVLRARYSDEEFFNIRCKVHDWLACSRTAFGWFYDQSYCGSKEIYHQHYGRYNIEKIWRDDILPCRTYLRHCVLAAKNLGDEAYNNFLDHTYLADRRTTIREYLASTGSGIMDEEPPESLKTRYGG